MATLQFDRHDGVKPRSRRPQAAIRVPDKPPQAAEEIRLPSATDDERRLRRSSDMSLVGQMASGVAHDFNNRLQSVMDALDLLKLRIEQGRSAECDMLMESAQDSLLGAAHLTRQLLNFARPSISVRNRIDINQAVGSMDAILRCVARGRVDLDIQLEAGPMFAYCDRHQLENALLNLVVNAKDAMPAGGRIQVEICRAELKADIDGLKPGRYVRFSVSDTGTGMTEETIRRAFEPFFTTKPAGKGTGLGLSMIKAFVDQSGGHIHLQSAVGIGTTISIYLPCESA